VTVQVVSTQEKDLAKFALSIQQLAAGRSNATGTFTLTAGATSTAVTAPNCSINSVPLVSPTTANAAAEMGNGTMYIGTIADGSFTVTHANNGQTDRTFRWVAIG
jgi:hypothetical protein